MSVLVISTGFLILFLIFNLRWTLYCAVSIGVIGILSSWLTVRIDWLWMKLAHLLGFVTQNILLSVLFFLILFPVSLISKLFVKDPLMLSDSRKSYFTDVTKETHQESFEKPW
jgi:hypothetical protein